MFTFSFTKSFPSINIIFSIYYLLSEEVAVGRVLINIPSGITDITKVANEINPRSLPLNW